MRKRYILLKDSPEVKAGAILEERCDNGDQNYIVIEGEYQIKGKYESGNGKVVFWKDIVEKQPDWFEKVELLWLTGKQIGKVKKILKI